MEQSNAKFDFIVVGSGLFGATCARFLADAKKQVLVLERRPQLGGNVSTHVEDGIIVHDYGPHIFHTDSKEAYELLQKYAPTYPFINSPLANYHGEIYHLPFNMNTFHELYGVVTPEEAKTRIAREVAQEDIGEPKNLEEQAIKLVGRTLYEKLIKGYTEKQWGRDCKDLPAFIIKRVPLRFTYDNNYYSDHYQCLVKGGYQVLIESLLKDIPAKVNTDYFSNKDEFNRLGGTIIFTGLIDRFFDYELGHLEYRSLRFQSKELNCPDFQSNPVVNYTAREVPYTRVTEHKHFDPYCQNETSTIITYEFPDSYELGKEPYYPINDERNGNLYASYEKKAQALAPKFYFGGRLGQYRYFDMDDAMMAGRDLALSLLKKQK